MDTWYKVDELGAEIVEVFPVRETPQQLVFKDGTAKDKKSAKDSYFKTHEEAYRHAVEMFLKTP